MKKKMNMSNTDWFLTFETSFFVNVFLLDMNIQSKETLKLKSRINMCIYMFLFSRGTIEILTSKKNKEVLKVLKSYNRNTGVSKHQLLKYFGEVRKDFNFIKKIMFQYKFLLEKYRVSEERLMIKWHFLNAESQRKILAICCEKYSKTKENKNYFHFSHVYENIIKKFKHGPIQP